MPKIISWVHAHTYGLKRYYTGEPCVHGHHAERYVSCNGCVECIKANACKWKSENPKKVNERRRRYNQKRYQSLKQNTKRWNKERDRQYKQRQENRALILAARLLLGRGIE